MHRTGCGRKHTDLPIYERVNYRMDSWEVLGNNTESEKMRNQYAFCLFLWKVNSMKDKSIILKKTFVPIKFFIIISHLLCS